MEEKKIKEVFINFNNKEEHERIRQEVLITLNRIKQLNDE